MELSDTGCDARIPIAAVPPNVSQYYSSKFLKPKMNESWKLYYDKKPGNRYHRDVFRSQGGRNANTEDLYFATEANENNLQVHID